MENGQFGSKIKNAKKMYDKLIVRQSIRVVVCKKPLLKTPNIPRNETHFENWPKLAKGYSPCKAYSPCKMVNLDQKLKMLKRCDKLVVQKSIRVVVCKKPVLKTTNTGESEDDFENRPKLAKGYSPCKAYSPCKMVSLGQILKMAKTVR